MPSRSSLLRFLVLLAALTSRPLFAPLHGQETTAAPVIRAETRIVQIDVLATDSHGGQAGNLSKQDFVVTDNGKPRAIELFSTNTVASASTANQEHGVLQAAPSSQQLPPNVFSNRNDGPPRLPAHSTVILLDQVNAYFEDAAFARQQVMDLMSKVSPDERIALYVISHVDGLVVLQDYTTDHELIVRSLSKRIPRGVGPGPIGFDQPIPPSIIKSPSAEEVQYLWHMNSEQARLSLQALAEFLAQTPGRKSVFWITQGFPPRFMKDENKPAWDKTITALNEANVAVNTFDPRGVFVRSNPVTGTWATVQHIADGTGGEAYFGRNEIETAMAAGIQASRTTYTLAFYLTESERDNTFHTLKVQTIHPGLKLFYRQGYYAGDTDLPGSSAMAGEKGELESALLNQVNADAIGITAGLDIKLAGAQTTATLSVTVDARTLLLKDQPSGAHGKLEDLFLEMDESGKTLGRVSDKKEFDVTRETRASFDNEGVRWEQSVPVEPGATRITIIVRDSNSGHMGSLTIPLPGTPGAATER